MTSKGLQRLKNSTCKTRFQLYRHPRVTVPSISENENQVNQQKLLTYLQKKPPKKSSFQCC